MIQEPTYHIAEVFLLIDLIGDIETMLVLKSVLDEEQDRYSFLDIHNMKTYYEYKVDMIKRWKENTK
jgi:hypothetical protein